MLARAWAASKFFRRSGFLGPAEKRLVNALGTCKRCSTVAAVSQPLADSVQHQASRSCATVGVAMQVQSTTRPSRSPPSGQGERDVGVLGHTDSAVTWLRETRAAIHEETKNMTPEELRRWRNQRPEDPALARLFDLRKPPEGRRAPPPAAER